MRALRTSSSGRSQRFQRGFSLLELLVAFSIMAMSLGLLYNIAGSSMGNVATLEQRQRAELLADSLLNARDAVSDKGWNDNGESAGMRWQVRSELFPTEVTDPRAPKLHQIQIVVEWGEGEEKRLIELYTLLPERKPLPGEVM